MTNESIYIRRFLKLTRFWNPGFWKEIKIIHTPIISFRNCSTFKIQFLFAYTALITSWWWSWFWGVGDGKKTIVFHGLSRSCILGKMFIFSISFYLRNVKYVILWWLQLMELTEAMYQSTRTQWVRLTLVITGNHPNHYHQKGHSKLK